MIVAITGDIGAGKSAAATFLAEDFVCPLLDADKITDSLWQLDSIKGIFVDRWGEEILNPSGDIIKSEVARRIFSDVNEYTFCNSVIHPLVMDELEAKAKDFQKLGFKHVILEVPLLFEAYETLPDWIDMTIYVTADFDIRLIRCQTQRGWDENELKRRESFLLPFEKKFFSCDYKIKNDGDLDKLSKRCYEIFVNILIYERKQELKNKK